MWPKICGSAKHLTSTSIGSWSVQCVFPPRYPGFVKWTRQLQTTSKPLNPSQRGLHSAFLGSPTSMPRKQQLPRKRAVVASPLFKLASEVRIRIYELLLIQDGGICIPSDLFVRRDYGRTHSGPCECLFCGLVFVSDHGCSQHYAKGHRSKSPETHQYPRHLFLPEVTISLLQTCRIIRDEASPILYSKNIFHFVDPNSTSNFRWRSNCVQASAIKEIRIQLGSVYYKRVSRWVTYFTKQTHGLGQDFPHLSRMTIDLDYWVGLESAHLLRSMSEGFKGRPQGLEWVLVLKLSQEEVLDCFEPLIDRKSDSKNGEQEVRRYISIVPVSGGSWRDAILWWGSPDEAVPQKYKLLVG